MAGCYVDRGADGKRTWTERMAADGQLYDVEKDGALVGSWWIEDDGVICFYYTDRLPGPHCYTGRRRGNFVDYYWIGNGLLVATTDCGPAPVASLTLLRPHANL
jgi:hypothetical protein